MQHSDYIKHAVVLTVHLKLHPSLDSLIPSAIGLLFGLKGDIIWVKDLQIGANAFELNLVI